MILQKLELCKGQNKQSLVNKLIRCFSSLKKSLKDLFFVSERQSLHNQWLEMRPQNLHICFFIFII